jgi:hypothetical protein
MGVRSNDDVRISSVQQFVEVVCRYRDQWIEGSNYFDPWFRGQRCAAWPLEPNIFRDKLLAHEDSIRDEFQRRAPQYMTELPPADSWAWYFLMQHYGAPTRLLDWSDSALVALFFALHSTSQCKEESQDAVVWMLDPWWLNKTVLNTETVLMPDHPAAGQYLTKLYSQLDENRNSLITPQDPIAIDPPFIARRIAVQRSRFTIFGHARDGLMRLRSREGSRIAKITLAEESADRMRADLLTLGVSDTSIYPDLQGLSKELASYYLGDWPPYQGKLKRRRRLGGTPASRESG